MKHINLIVYYYVFLKISKNEKEIKICQEWDLNPRPFGPEPKSGALDHSAKLSRHQFQ